MAFGPVGPLAKSILTNAGYEISRPTRFERSMLRSPFSDWYGNDIALFAEVYQANRETLSKVKEWAKPNDLENSLWRYGVPEQWDASQQGMGKTGLNEVEIEPT